MSEKHERFYEFDGFRFHPHERLLTNTRKGHPFRLMPKANGFLLALIERRGEVVSYDDLKKLAWSESAHVSTHTVRETKRSLRDVLGDTADKIETVTGKGYRFNCEVVVFDNYNADASRDESLSVDSPETIEPNPPPDAPIASPSIATFATHRGHQWASCALYALLYVVAVFVEIAYQYDRFGATAWRLAVPVFLWMFTTSLFGLENIKRRAGQSNAQGIIIALLIFACAAFTLHFALGFFLPTFPITEAKFQTYSAHGAYLKSAAYFLFIAVLFLIVPFHFVAALQAQARAGGNRMVSNLLAGSRRGTLPADAL